LKVKALGEMRAFRSEGNGPLPLRELRSAVPYVASVTRQQLIAKHEKRLWYCGARCLRHSSLTPRSV